MITVETEREAMARNIAGDHYGLSLFTKGEAREYYKGRLTDQERESFDAGWEAAKQYYLNQPKVSDVQSK